MRHALSLVIVAALAGCAILDPASTTGERAGTARPSAPGGDAAERRLLEAAERAEAALSLLARQRSGQADPAAAPPPRVVPPALLARVELDWTGPLTGLARSLARYAGYRFEVTGRTPARPLLVALESRDRPLIALLRDAGLQAGAQATLTVDARRRAIALEWRVATPERRR